MTENLIKMFKDTLKMYEKMVEDTKEAIKRLQERELTKSQEDLVLSRSNE